MFMASDNWIYVYNILQMMSYGDYTIAVCDTFRMFS